MRNKPVFYPKKVNVKDGYPALFMNHRNHRATALFATDFFTMSP